MNGIDHYDLSRLLEILAALFVFRWALPRFMSGPGERRRKPSTRCSRTQTEAPEFVTVWPTVSPPREGSA